MSAEQQRLDEAREKNVPWKKWGPYLSERQWGTVREDYSDNGNAWDYFSHDQARSRAYHWGEDGLAGISDDDQRLCFAVALWNGKDPIIKERLFGLTNSEGNHGEDVKEYYFYLDSTPTHSYLKYLYKYPQAVYPYDTLVATNRQRDRNEPEYELIDTGVFNENRYFDVFVEYAKQSPEEILIQITVLNRGPEAAVLHVLPTLWFRNRWSWGQESSRPHLELVQGAAPIVRAVDFDTYFLYCDGKAKLLFTENETNHKRLFKSENRTPYVKDAINNYLVHGETEAVNPKNTGTKVAADYFLHVLPGKSEVVCLRLTKTAPVASNGTNTKESTAFGRQFDKAFQARRDEADEFYAAVIPRSLNSDEQNVMRQALAGMLWSKQFYYFDVNRWLEERGCDPYMPTGKKAPRNEHWHHMYNADVISMPDKWEYPWYAAWDLAFHILPLTLVDPDFGKEQLNLMLKETYLHPNGQIPAYEWNFGDVNPPVHPWATLFTYRLDKERTGKGDTTWLERSFQKLLLNFTWWINRKDRSGKNAFEGGFLGLDNIGVFDRSSPLPTGGYLEQADGTAWMALFSLNMLEISIELALHDATYTDMVLKFVYHFISIASATISAGGKTGMWDEEDGFFYDVLQLPNGQAQRLKVRSMVGLLPLCAVTVFEGELQERYPEVIKRLGTSFKARPELVSFIHDPTKTGVKGRRLGAILDETKLRRVLATMLDENEFLSPYGIRSLSRFHAEHPYVFNAGGQDYRVSYLPGDSDTGMFGGNSNWRGPIWMPVNALIIRALLQYYLYYGDDFKVECPTGSGEQMTLYQVAEEISRRLASIFLKNDQGARPVNAGTKVFEQDPNWSENVLFYEFFHGDTGAGLGASHQTGWTGVIARAMHLFATKTAEEVREFGQESWCLPEEYFYNCAGSEVSWLGQMHVTHPVAHALAVLALVCVAGLALGSLKVRGVGVGVAGVLFAGIIIGHFGSPVESGTLSFVKEFGLILFVFAIGLQLGPGFFAAMREQGLKMNGLATLIVLLGALAAPLIGWLAGFDPAAVLGIFSGASVNMPSLGAATQTLQTLPNITPERLALPALACAVTFPTAIMGSIVTLLLLQKVFRIDAAQQAADYAARARKTVETLERRTLVITNPNLEGLRLAAIPGRVESGVTISRVGHNGETTIALESTVVHNGDYMTVVGTTAGLERFTRIVGKTSEEDLALVSGHISYRRIVVTARTVLGKTIGELDLNTRFNVAVTRVTRAGIEMSAAPDLRLRFGDMVQIVGQSADLDKAAAALGNSLKELNETQFITFFTGIFLGVLLGTFPITLGGLPQPLRLGLAGGPLIVALILGRIGRIGPLVCHMPVNANLAFRDFGIAFFFAAVGLEAGPKFFATVFSVTGLQWLLAGAAVTVIPLLVIGIFACRSGMNFMDVSGLLAGSTTNPPALAFATNISGSEAPTLTYATVYPLTMLLRILCAQILALTLVR